MNFLNSRLRKAEERARGGRCPECGLSPHDSEAKRRLVTCCGEEGIPDEDLPESCPECGLPEVVVLRLVEEGGDEAHE